MGKATFTQLKAQEKLHVLAKLQDLEPVLKAAAGGKTIQVFDLQEGWRDSDCLSFGLDPERYRVKPFKPVKVLVGWKPINDGYRRVIRWEPIYEENNHG